MCLAVIKPVGVVCRWQDLKDGFTSNTDGCGFAYADGDTIVSGKGLWKWRKFQRAAWNVNREDIPALFHFRAATHGKVTDALCHPFTFDSHGIDYAVVHNGVFHRMKTSNEVSDTLAFVNGYIKFLYDLKGPDAMDDEHLNDMLSRMGDGTFNRIAILRRDGGIRMIGDWVEIDGCFYSNTYSLGGVGSWLGSKETINAAASKVSNSYPETYPVSDYDYRGIGDASWESEVEELASHFMKEGLGVHEAYDEAWRAYRNGGLR